MKAPLVVLMSLMLSSCSKSQDDPELLFNKGTQLWFGSGGHAVDRHAACDLFSVAAEKGFSKALYNLGECYRLGEGVSQDLEKAATYFKRAFEGGLEEGAISYAGIMLFEIGDKRACDVIHLLENSKNAWKKEFQAKAEFFLGAANVMGACEGKVDYVAGILHYEKSASGGDVLAQASLAYFYENGLYSCEIDKEKFELYKNMVEGENVNSKGEPIKYDDVISLIKKHGWGLPKNS